MFNVRWSKLYNSDLYHSNNSMKDLFLILGKKCDDCFGWSYIGKGWNCDDDKSLINGMSESQKRICMAIIKIQNDCVPCDFGSNRPILPPPSYSDPALTQRNDVPSGFYDDFQFGSGFSMCHILQ